MRMIDFSHWHTILSTLGSLALITVIGMGLRILVMMTVQERRQRQNRQINERLKVLIAAYKTLGGSFTGDLTVDPLHMRDIVRAARESGSEGLGDFGDGETRAEPNLLNLSSEKQGGSDRARRIRDAVEAALSDILLLGTEDQVRLAASSLSELIAGRQVHTHKLVVSLRDFIRNALDLDPIPPEVANGLPAQGPARPGASSGSGGRSQGDRGQDGGGGSGGGLAGGMGGGMMVGGGLAGGASHGEETSHETEANS